MTWKLNRSTLTIPNSSSAFFPLSTAVTAMEMRKGETLISGGKRKRRRVYERSVVSYLCTWSSGEAPRWSPGQPSCRPPPAHGSPPAPLRRQLRLRSLSLLSPATTLQLSDQQEIDRSRISALRIARYLKGGTNKEQGIATRPRTKTQPITNLTRNVYPRYPTPNLDNRIASLQTVGPTFFSQCLTRWVCVPLIFICRERYCGATAVSWDVTGDTEEDRVAVILFYFFTKNEILTYLSWFLFYFCLGNKFHFQFGQLKFLTVGRQKKKG